MDKVVLHSIWRNDENRFIQRRIAHLLSKTYPDLRWVWVVGDSSDGTEAILRMEAKKSGKDVTVIRHDTHIEGGDPNTRVRRISQTYNLGFDDVRPDDEFWCLHESDLISPPNVIERFIASGHCPVAGWITLGENGCFYDTWAYRINGKMFSNAETRPVEPIEVDSFGSVGFFHANDLRAGVRTESFDFIELCEKLKNRGHSLWIDPSITIVQPMDLWVPYSHAG